MHRAARAASLTLACLLPVLAAGAPDFTSQRLAPRHAAPTGAKAFSALSPAESGMRVPNEFADPRMWGERFREFVLGALETGVAVADFDRDGRPDVFAVSKTGPCALYRQTGPLQFTDIAAAAGVECAGPAPRVGATAVDINQDGWLDLYVCRYDAPNLLFINNGNLTFTEKAHDYGLDVKDASVHASFADYDGDGDLDAYLVTNILDFSQSPLGRPDRLLRNEGNGKFTDATKAARMWGVSQGHSAIWFDANRDGWPDLYVANDFETPDRFYLNKGDGTFADVVDQRLPHVTYFSMGSDSGDLNNDGHVDFMVADMRDRSRREYMVGMEEMGRGIWELERVSELIPQYMWNALYLGTGTDRYQEAAHLAGLDASGWTWAVRFADLDNDGAQDVFMTAGMIRNFMDADLIDRQNLAPSLAARAAVWFNSPPRRERTLAFRNAGRLRFENVSGAWGLDHEGVSFGCAAVDLDGDGDLDLVYSNFEAPPTVVRNDTTQGHRVLVRLAGRAPNRDGIGAEVIVRTKSRQQVRQLYTERGIVASEPAIAHFGLGDDKKIEQLVVRWPSGEVQELKQLDADRLYTINEPGEGTPPKRPPPRAWREDEKGPAYEETSARRSLEYVSKAKPVDEFVSQRLLPRRYSQQAPALATADVNHDGMADFYVTGAAGQPGTLFLGAADGTFTPSPSQPWTEARDADDTGALFLDANGDGHPDLFVAAGGVIAPAGNPLLNDRLYLGDAAGIFTPAPSGYLPADGDSTTACAAADFDGDGRIDLYTGGRTVPGRWPEVPRSRLLRNTGQGFVDETDRWAPALRHAGMVTAAIAADLNGDKRVDLVLATEWGPVRVFLNNGQGLEEATDRVGLGQLPGWWNAVAVADVNGDGRPDIIAGNTGLNTKHRASASAPATVLAGSFDATGRTTIIEAAYDTDGRLYPVRGKSKLAYSLPWMRSKYPTFRAFADATVEDIFPADKLKSATRLTATELASGIFLQRENGGFEFHALPSEAQLAPVNAIAVRDFDGDGRDDLYLAGNFFGPEPTTGRFDGGVSLLLRGDGRGGFAAVSPSASGLVVPREARAVAVLPALVAGGRPRIAVAQCAGRLLFFEATSPGAK